MVIVTELLLGGTLRKYLLNMRPRCLETRVAVGFALDIARAMECLHSHGIIHRDLKPGNALSLINPIINTVTFVVSKWARAVRPFWQLSGFDSDCWRVMIVKALVSSLMILSPLMCIISLFSHASLDSRTRDWISFLLLKGFEPAIHSPNRLSAHSVWESIGYSVEDSHRFRSRAF